MVAASRSAAGMGYIGYPAQIFYEKINFNRGPQLHIERLFILDKWFSDLRAFLPIHYEKDIDTYKRDILPKLDKINDELIDAWDAYRSTFEGEHSFDPNEKEFVFQLRTVLIDLDEVTAISRVIDKQKMSDEELIV